MFFIKSTNTDKDKHNGKNKCVKEEITDVTKWIKIAMFTHGHPLDCDDKDKDFYG